MIKAVLIQNHRINMWYVLETIIPPSYKWLVASKTKFGFGGYYTKNCSFNICTDF